MTFRCLYGYFSLVLIQFFNEKMEIKKKKIRKKWLLVRKGMSLKLQRKAVAIVHEIDAIKEKILFSAE